MAAPERIPVRIPVTPGLLDHCIDGRPVLPAVIALKLLADGFAWANHEQRDASFRRFLDLPRDASSVEALGIREPAPQASRVVLATVRQVGSFTRTLEHAAVTPHEVSDSPMLPPDLAAAPEGTGCRVTAAEIYARLIPFGETFQNLNDPVVLTRAGATGRVHCPAATTEAPDPGVIYPLDAAFHLACAWSRCYLGVPTFPVGFDRRAILRPAAPGEQLWARVTPLDTPIHRGRRFDLWLHDDLGQLREACLGVQMVDLFHTEPDHTDPLFCRPSDAVVPAPDGVLESVLLELDGVTPAARATLTLRERARMQGMAPRRLRSYLGARVALKQLRRRLGPQLRFDCPVETLAADNVRPACGDAAVHVSAAHDDRFVVAVAANAPVGVDVERISDKAQRGARLFLDEKEAALGAAEPGTATRLWTVKEAVAKAANLTLAEAWRRVRITRTDLTRTAFTLDGATSSVALHARLDDHILTVLTLQGERS